MISFSPPWIDLSKLMSPPCDLIISLVIVNPKPLSPFNLFLAGSHVKNGLKTSSYLSSGIPGPLSWNSIIKPSLFLNRNTFISVPYL